jgi:AcrR family transcriptional regulator
LLVEKRRSPRKRLSREERKALIIERAADHLADNGFPVRTREIAAAAGISQRLLYHFFPGKQALIDEIYASAVQGPFKAIWFVELADRRRPVAVRLRAFYRDYFDTLLTRRWTRLLIHSSFSEQNMAPRYISGIILRLLETIVDEVAAERGVALPEEKPVIHEIGWVLHGAVSHLAIRRHLFQANLAVPVEPVLDAQIDSFLAGFEAMLQALRRPAEAQASEQDGGDRRRSRNRAPQHKSSIDE